MLRQCMLNVKNQSYKDYLHTVNIVSDEGVYENFYNLYNDLLDDKLVFVSNNNQHIHINEMKAIKHIVNYNDYDVFVKMDDDDVYKKDYIKNIVETFEKNPGIDIVSSKIKSQLNGIRIFKNHFGYDNLGGNPNNSTYHMPMTFAFNIKALNCIIDTPEKEINWNDDLMWRNIWEKNNLNHLAVDNSEEIIWHIHGKNISTSSFLK